MKNEIIQDKNNMQSIITDKNKKLIFKQEVVNGHTEIKQIQEIKNKDGNIEVKEIKYILP